MIILNGQSQWLTQVWPVIIFLGEFLHCIDIKNQVRIVQRVFWESFLQKSPFYEEKQSQVTI
jgi:hypothetical protein